MDATYDQILRELEKLSDKIDAIQPPKENTQSSQLDKLYEALALAQNEFPIASLNNKNPYYSTKYADFSAVVHSSRGPLTKNSLAVIQQIRTNHEGQSILHTRLGHSSGQWIETQMRINPPKNDIQRLGSYLESLKRYSYASLVGIVAQGEDDDGEIAMIDARKILAKGPSTKYDPKNQDYDTITREQLEEIEYELGDYEDIAESIMDAYRIQNLADIPKNKFRAAITRIREIIATRDGTE